MDIIRSSPLKKRFITIFLLPSDSSKAKKYKVPFALYNAGRIAFVAFMLLCIYIAVDYGNMRLKVRELNRIKKENTSQKIELQSLSAKISELETRMSKLKSFDKKLRIIANLEEPAPADREVMGMGGTSSDDEYFLSIEDKRGELIENMHSDIAQLEIEADMQEKSFTELQEFLIKQSSILASTPSILPTRGWITSTYGKRRDPFTGRRHMHKGMDIANRVGTPVIAPADGIVTRITRMRYLGKMLEISHGYGIKTRYGHLSKINVRVGQKVKRGDKIAVMGNTGRSTGPHLHYEVVVNGVHVNPSRYVLN